MEACWGLIEFKISFSTQSLPCDVEAFWTGLGRTGVLWYRREVRERRKREGGQKGGELDLEAERAPVSGPAWPPDRGAACARARPPSFPSGGTVAVSAPFQGVKRRLSAGWHSRLQAVSWGGRDLNPGLLTPSPLFILTAVLRWLLAPTSSPAQTCSHNAMALCLGSWGQRKSVPGAQSAWAVSRWVTGL